MYVAEVRVGFKHGVADPEGENTRKTLELLGFDTVQAVRAARVFQIEIEADDEPAARDQVEQMCSKLLANPVVHTYTIELAKAEVA